MEMGGGDHHLAKTTVVIVVGQNAHWRLKLAGASMMKNSTFVSSQSISLQDSNHTG